MSELQQLKEELHAYIEEQTSVEVLREMTSHIQSQSPPEVIEIGPEMQASLQRAEEQSRRGEYYTIEEARQMMEAKYPYLKRKA